MNHCKDEETAQNSSRQNTDINQSFGCSLLTASVKGYLASFAYIIPSYQRQYCWTKEQTERLCTEMFGYYQDTINEFLKLSKEQKQVEPVRPVNIVESARTYYSKNGTTDQTEAKSRIIDKLKPNNKFVGTLILVEDDKLSNQTVNAKGLYGVIDGQQRLTTFCLLVACLFNRLIQYRCYFVKAMCSCTDDGISGKAEVMAYTLYIQSLDKMCDTLRKCLMHTLEDKNHKTFSWPTVCREKEDQSSQADESDIRRLCSYVGGLDHTLTKESITGLFKHDQLEGKEAELIVRNAKTILESNIERKLLDDCYKQTVPPAIENVTQTIGAFLDLVAWRPLNDLKNWDTKKLPEELKQRSVIYSIDMPNSSVEYEDICRFSGSREGRGDFGFDDSVLTVSDERIRSFVRLVSFGSYMLNNVFMAAVVCQPENFLDIFESLNSAGRPLTSIETFIPRVHKFFALQALNPLSGEKATSYLREKIWKSSINENQSEFQGLRPEEYVSPDDYLTAINKLIEFHPNVDSKEIVISFALLVTGQKCGRSANDQKKFLEGTFSKSEKVYRDTAKNSVSQNYFEPIRRYVNGLYQTIKWWCMLLEPKDDKGRFESLFCCSEAVDKELSSKIDEAKFCLAVMRDAGFELPLTVACRYYIQFLDYENESRQFGDFFKDKSKSDHECKVYLEKVRRQSFEYYLDVICSLAAFTGIWRSLYPGTNGIETAFRKIIEGRGKDNQDLAPWGELTIPTSADLVSSRGTAVLKKTRDENGLISAEVVRHRLRTLLNEAMSVDRRKLTEEDGFTLGKWQKMLRTSMTGGINMIPRFLLLAYMTNTECDPDSKSAGLRRYRKGAGKNYLTYSSWTNTYNRTDYQVEHVIPQKNDGEWWSAELKGLDKEETEQLVHELGNLLLLPARGNNLIKNKPWSLKHFAYQCMGTLNPKKHDELREQLDPQKKLEVLAQQLDEDLSKTSTYESLKSLLDQPASDAVIEFDEGPKDWDKDFVHQRSNRMVEVIWENFEPFLQLSKLRAEWKKMREDQEKERNFKKRPSGGRPAKGKRGRPRKESVADSNLSVEYPAADTSKSSSEAAAKGSQRRKQKTVDSSDHEQVSEKTPKTVSHQERKPSIELQSLTETVRKEQVASKIEAIISKLIPNVDKTIDAWVWKTEDGDEFRLTFESEKLKLYIPQIKAGKRPKGYSRMKVDGKGWKVEFSDPGDWTGEDSERLSTFLARNLGIVP